MVPSVPTRRGVFPLGTVPFKRPGQDADRGWHGLRVHEKDAPGELLSATTAIREFALFPELDDETVPLGFPVCVDDQPT